MGMLTIIASKGRNQVTSAEVLSSGKLRFREGHLPRSYRTPREVREKISMNPEKGVVTQGGVTYSWSVD